MVGLVGYGNFITNCGLETRDDNGKRKRERKWKRERQEGKERKYRMSKTKSGGVNSWEIQRDEGDWSVMLEYSWIHNTSRTCVNSTHAYT